MGCHGGVARPLGFVQGAERRETRKQGSSAAMSANDLSDQRATHDMEAVADSDRDPCFQVFEQDIREISYGAFVIGSSISRL